MKIFKLTSILIVFSTITLITSCDKDDDVLGCTDSAATNFDASATEDDGSCTYEEDTPGFGLAVALISIIGVAFRRRN